MGNRVLVSTAQRDKKTESGIVLPDNIDGEKPAQGKVVAVGEGKKTEVGEIIPVSVKVGDTILFSKYSGEEIEFEGESYLIIEESSILAVIK